MVCIQTRKRWIVDNDEKNASNTMSGCRGIKKKKRGWETIGKKKKDEFELELLSLGE